MSDSDTGFTVKIEPPELEVTVEMTRGLTATLSYPLEEVINLEGEDVEILESTETGFVVQNSKGETEHIDLRDL